jgi:hypothetical protein
MRKILFAAGFMVTLPLAFGQSARPLVGKDVAAPSERFPAEWYPKLNGTSTSAPIAGAPYIATWTMTTEVLDGEGKPIGKSAWRALKWRDSAGRTRDEELFSEMPNLQRMPNEITVNDTVHHCGFTWYEPVTREQDREATVNCYSIELYRTDDSPAKQMADPKPGIKHEQFGNMTQTTTTTPLGGRSLHGLEVVGIHSVTTEVDAEGKLQSTKEGEIWWSPALYETILMTVKTRENLVTMEMSDIRREEPNAGLFYPPEGYHFRKEAEVPPMPVPPER